MGNTTEAARVVTGRPASDVSELALVWVFPRPSEPAAALPHQGGAEWVIGRDEGCEIRLSGSDVSRRHAALRQDGAGAVDAGGGIQVVDLASRNGVHVNGRQVSTAPLRRGDVLRLGGWIGVVTDAPGSLEEIAPGLLGGASLRAVLEPLRRAAPSDLPIVIEGETGTGKEIVARTIHAWSGRSGRLVAVNCAALPEALAEGELFGYRRGAFTGADRPSAGFFRGADGGTLLLDEVTDLPLPLQAKLLRVLEQREVQPLGEPHPIPIDVRVVVAAQQSLREATRQGRFRPDLLARLDGVTVRLPPLRSRREDVPPLFSHFLGELRPGQAPALEGDLVERLCLYDWPFNVRELVLLARRLIVLHPDQATLRASHLPDRIDTMPAAAFAPAPPFSPASAAAAPPPRVLPAPPLPEAVELPALVAALRACAGNVARAAALLGITRQRAYRLMEGKAVDLEALRNHDHDQDHDRDQDRDRDQDQAQGPGERPGRENGGQ